MIGKKIINYQIKELIGQGGMASVYLAEHEKLKTKAAIKILNPVLAANNDIRQRFENEARMMASLDHPNIIRVYDFMDEDGILAIIMEYLQGYNLDEWMKKNGPMPTEQTIPMFQQVLSAFAYAHDQNIIHRDIKPSNIFLINEKTPKILDFGIAKLVQEGSKALTQTGTQMGTPVYMSPEQVNDAKHIDHRSDIYSLGVTLWTILAGKPPYDTEAESTFAIYKKIDGEPLTQLPISNQINHTIEKATEKNKSNRVNNCVEFSNLISNTRPEKTTNIEKTIIETKETNHQNNDSQLNDDKYQTKSTNAKISESVDTKESKVSFFDKYKTSKSTDKFTILNIFIISSLIFAYDFFVGYFTYHGLPFEFFIDIPILILLVSIYTKYRNRFSILFLLFIFISTIKYYFLGVGFELSTILFYISFCIFLALIYFTIRDNKKIPFLQFTLMFYLPIFGFAIIRRVLLYLSVSIQGIEEPFYLALDDFYLNRNFYAGLLIITIYFVISLFSLYSLSFFFIKYSRLDDRK